MIVYSDRRVEASTREQIGEVAGLIREVAQDGGRATAVDAFLRWAQLEPAIADALFPDRDDVSAAGRDLRTTGDALARLYLEHDCARRTYSAAAAFRVLDAASRHDLPARVSLGELEGYSWYSLYPEMYAAAARRFCDATPRGHACVIGIRGIGASLASIVRAVLEENGWTCESVTVRPRGHPFDRTLAMSAALEARLAAQKQGWFLVVDEGPGISGSSFASVVHALERLGAPLGRIVLFPAWVPDASQLKSETARHYWTACSKFAGCFDEIDLSLTNSRELSAGSWREHVYRPSDEWPPVHPQHERRKFLLDRRVLLKFAGLGHFGRTKHSRALRLAELGWTPRPAYLRDGFLATEWLDGKPLRASDGDAALVNTLADYAVTLKREFPARQTNPVEAIADMVRQNSYDALGIQVDEIPGSDAASDSEPIEVDGRILPHEWLRTPTGYIKTDALDHHHDHFFPGRQDIAWDLAGAIVEFELQGSAAELLVSRYHAQSGDRHVAARLPFYLIAYLAYRTGYATLAAQTAGDKEQERWSALLEKYRARLRRQLLCSGDGVASGVPARAVD